MPNSNDYTRIRSVRELGINTHPLLPPAMQDMAGILRYTNASPALQAAWSVAYDSRTAQLDDISLVAMPQHAQLCPAAGFALKVGNDYVADQINPNAPLDLDQLDSTFANAPAEYWVPGDSLLVVRYGEGTWGHWLVELLPKVAVCERMYPGRFKYVMAYWVLNTPMLAQRVLESLALYGVGTDRLIVVGEGARYRFENLHCLSPVFFDFCLHPGVRDILIDDARGIDEEPMRHARVALLRTDVRRGLRNLPEVERLLHHRGFSAVDLGALSVTAQLRIFTTADFIFSVLGSTLSGLAYVRRPLRVVTTAPARFGDRFFYSLLQPVPDSAWAEVRGPVVQQDDQEYRNSAFEISLDVLNHALDVAYS